MKHIHIGRSLPVDVKLKDNLISFASVNRQIWTASILSVSGNNQVYTLRNQQWNRRLNAGTVYEAEFIVSTTSGVSPSFSFLMEDHPACDDVTSEVYRNTFRTTIIILLPTLLCFILQTYTVIYPAFICYTNTKITKRLNIKLAIGEQYLSSCIIIVSVFVQNSVLNKEFALMEIYHENRNATYSNELTPLLM